MTDEAIARAVGRVEEHNSEQDKKLNEILGEIKEIKNVMVQTAQDAIHNKYALDALHKRVDKVEKDIDAIKGKIKGNVTWPGVVALITKAGAFFGGLGIIATVLVKLLK